jgi:hypothetical protein
VGYDSVGWSIAGSVSRHNSPRDKEDDELWEDLVERLKAIRDEPKYERLNLV